MHKKVHFIKTLKIIFEKVDNATVILAKAIFIQFQSNQEIGSIIGCEVCRLR